MVPHPSFKEIADIPHLLFFLVLKKNIANLSFLHDFSTDFAHFFTEMSGKISLFEWCYFCGLSHVRFSAIFKKPDFQHQYTDYAGDDLLEFRYHLTHHKCSTTAKCVLYYPKHVFQTSRGLETRYPTKLRNDINFLMWGMPAISLKIIQGDMEWTWHTSYLIICLKSFKRNVTTETILIFYRILRNYIYLNLCFLLLSNPQV